MFLVLSLLIFTPRPEFLNISLLLEFLKKKKNLIIKNHKKITERVEYAAVRQKFGPRG